MCLLDCVDCSELKLQYELFTPLKIKSDTFNRKAAVATVATVGIRLVTVMFKDSRKVLGGRGQKCRSSITLTICLKFVISHL